MTMKNPASGLAGLILIVIGMVAAFYFVAMGWTSSNESTHFAVAIGLPAIFISGFALCWCSLCGLPSRERVDPCQSEKATVKESALGMTGLILVVVGLVGAVRFLLVASEGSFDFGTAAICFVGTVLGLCSLKTRTGHVAAWCGILILFFWLPMFLFWGIGLIMCEP
jgi:Na+/melibiose symporter-like transporter